ncbi:MAG: DUF2071 domain-containing protein [Planctomycetota bacterium]
MRIPLPFPVSMQGVLDPCLLVSLKTPAEAVEHLIPPPLRLMTHDAGGERWAFWNVVVCRVERMRPLGVPRVFGVSYAHIAYRLMVETDTARGPMSGLYFIRSDADSSPIVTFGDPVSDFRFRRCRASGASDRSRVRSDVTSADARADLTIEASEGDEGTWDDGGLFASPQAMRRALKYRPVSMAPDATGRVLRLAEVFREESEWDEQPVRLEQWNATLFRSLGVPEPEPVLATRVARIDYRWRLGRTCRLFNRRPSGVSGSLAPACAGEQEGGPQHRYR